MIIRLLINMKEMSTEILSIDDLTASRSIQATSIGRGQYKIVDPVMQRFIERINENNRPKWESGIDQDGVEFYWHPDFYSQAAEMQPDGSRDIIIDILFQYQLIAGGTGQAGGRSSHLE